MHFLLGHEIKCPFLVSKTGVFRIMHKLVKESQGKREILSSIFSPFTNGKSIVCLQLKAEQNVRMESGQHRLYLP